MTASSDDARRLTLRVLPGVYAIARLGPLDAVPNWADSPEFCAVVRTREELSIVSSEARVPEDVRCERGWRLLMVVGPLQFSEIGIVASIASPLAAAGVSIVSVATFDTDYVLVRGADLEKAVAALRAAGRRVEVQ